MMISFIDISYTSDTREIDVPVEFIIFLERSNNTNCVWIKEGRMFQVDGADFNKIRRAMIEFYGTK